MKHLLYCIFRPDLDQPLEEPGMCVVASGSLAAVVSPLEEATPTPSVASLLAYERVVEAIYARGAVIPLRYGCVVESRSAVVQLLKEHRPQYEAILGRLRDMAEMGIRVLCPARSETVAEIPLSPGAAYLASLRNSYGSTSSFAPGETQLADQIAGLLSGHYLEQQREISPVEQGRLVSMYFLTPKIEVEGFRNKARQIQPPSGTKLLLSGPWPPFNFAVSLD